MRTTDAATLAALSADAIDLYVFADFDFVDGHTYLWSGPLGTTITWGGQTWTGTGEIAALDRVAAEDAQLSDAPVTATVQFTGPLADDLGLLDNSARPVTISWVLADRMRGMLLGAPLIRQRYTLGGLSMQPSRERGQGQDLIRNALVVELAPATALLDTVLARRLSYQDGLSLDPNDHFLEFAGDAEMLHAGVARPVGGGPGREPGEQPRNQPGSALVPF